MSFVTVLIGIILLLVLIIAKLHPMLSLLVVSIITGLLLGMPIDKVMTSVTNGIGGTLGGMVMILALGAMLGKLVEESGAAKKLVDVLMHFFKRKNIQWAVLLTGIIVGIPLFYNAGFVVLIPLVFAISATTKLPLLYVGIPMASALSVTHGFLPPHPGPITLTTIFNASVGKTLMYGLLLSIPTAILAGIVYSRLIIKPAITTDSVEPITEQEERSLPSASRSFMIALMPVILIAFGTTGAGLSKAPWAVSFFHFLEDPTIALMVSLGLALLLLRIPLPKAMDICVEGVKSIAMIILIIAAGGGFKQILVDSGIGDQIAAQSQVLHLSPLLTAWLITALLRVTLGSATVSAVTASGLVLPFIKAGASPELMVLAVGAGSLFCSHFNDTGFWMFKEYFRLNIKQTFRTWTVMESLISILGLLGVLLLSLVF
ncbi:MAG: gluconate permease [Flavisolibacter sp.]|nr:gluconate permease [Flavisolibacter sp.]